MPKVNTQSIKFNWKGAYNPATAYVAKDVVSFKGQSFVCEVDAIGIDPTTTSNWSKHNSASNLLDIEPSENSILQFDGAGFTAVPFGTAGNLFECQGASAPIWSSFSSLVKEVLYRNVTDATIGNVSAGNVVDTFNFTPSVSGRLFVGYTFNYRSNANSSNYHYFRVQFNDGSQTNIVRYDGYNRATSGNGDHLQTAAAKFALNNANGYKAIAGTAQNFHMYNDSSGTAGISNAPGWRMSWVVLVI